FSLSFQPIAHPPSRDAEVARSDCLAFVSDAVHSDDSAAFHKEPDDAGVELAEVAQLEQAFTHCFRERLAMVLSIPQFRQAVDDCRMIIGIAAFQRIEKLSHRNSSTPAHIKLYGELHFLATSILMYS